MDQQVVNVNLTSRIDGPDRSPGCNR